MKKPSTKWIVIAIVLLVLVVIGKTLPEEKQPISEVNKVESKAIPGAMPVDVYLNLEKAGYNVDKELGSEGNLWVCTKDDYAINYNVTLFSEDVGTIESVRATAMITGKEQKKAIALKPFISYVATLPYTNSDAETIKQWVNENFDKDQSTVIIAKVKFTMYAKTPFIRMLTIEKA
tara:strand:+ start:11836 stop:12363 length:528 start_codon:yes stop_codon:yes gene_type:complete